MWLCEWLLKVFVLCWNTCVVEKIQNNLVYQQSFLKMPSMFFCEVLMLCINHFSYSIFVEFSYGNIFLC
jgi:hypothetical protein